MDPVSIALALAQFAPAIVRWVSGSDSAADNAAKIVQVATQVAGKADPAAAAASIQASAQLQAQFRELVMRQAQELELAYLGDRKDARARDVEFIRAGRVNTRANVMLLAAFAAVIAIASLLALGKVDAASGVGGFMLTIGGMFARNIGTAFDFEFGSSASSRAKDDVISQLAQK